DLRRGGRHRQARSLQNPAPGAATGSAHGGQQIQSQYRGGHQAGARRVFHAQEQNRLRARATGGRFGQKLIWPWPQPTRTPNWMRLTAMPLSVAEPHPWRSRAPSLRWAKPAIRRLDWELQPGPCARLTTPPTGSIDALAYRNERGRQD